MTPAVGDDEQARIAQRVGQLLRLQGLDDALRSVQPPGKIDVGKLNEEDADPPQLGEPLPLAGEDAVEDGGLT